jgi:pimeloyl-ACP methyl ester carboxylesterase
MAESTRPLPPLIPLPNGGWEATSYLSSVDYEIRGLGLVPPDIVIPVIVVPGIMGTNLRAKRHPTRVRKQKEDNGVLAPGESAWSPPNGKVDGIRASALWRKRGPKDRQLRFDGPTLEVDDGGPIVMFKAEDGYVLSEAELRQRGWGEVHSDSYGALLFSLQERLNQTFGFDEHKKQRYIKEHWKEIMTCDPRKWGVRELAPLTEAHLAKHAQNYFPVYAVGYNWLEDCEVSSLRLEKRINEIIAYWKGLKRRCDKVVLVTHSMGGLVARACAKRIPDKIAGVIHGVMPAAGAPVAYRRMVFGTEGSSPSNDPVENAAASRLAMILGQKSEHTTPVMATSPGALELLPNHMYPGPWVHVRVIRANYSAPGARYGAKDDTVHGQTSYRDYLHLPRGEKPNPYEFYRDVKSWFRLVNLALVDPARKYSGSHGGVEEAFRIALDTAERFHRSLGDYYHPNTYVFYGDDKNKLSYSHVRWTARQGPGTTVALTAADIASARFLGHAAGGHRRVLVGGKTELEFFPEEQDARGDGTVPHYSGNNPTGKVKQVFAARDIDHQNAYNNVDMLMLTLRLIVTIVQEMS